MFYLRENRIVSLSYFFREMAAPETRATTARAAATPTTSLAPVPGLVVVPVVVPAAVPGRALTDRVLLAV